MIHQQWSNSNANLSILVTFKFSMFLSFLTASSKYIYKTGSYFISIIVHWFFLYIASSSLFSTWASILRKCLPRSRFLSMIQYYVVLLSASRLEWDAPYSAYLLTTLYLLTVFIFSSQNFNKHDHFQSSPMIIIWTNTTAFQLRTVGFLLSFSPVTCMSQSRYSRITSNLWLKFYLIISKSVHFLILLIS